MFSCGTYGRPRAKEPRLFKFWRKASTKTDMKNLIAQAVVATSPVPATRTDQAVVAEPVHNTIAQGGGGGGELA